MHKTSLAHVVLWDMPQTTTVFHWHGDTFDLPDGALHLVYSDVCANQAFIWNDQVLGLQYHVELSPEHIEALIENVGHELDEAGDSIQSEPKIREGFAYADIALPIMDGMLNQFIG